MVMCGWSSGQDLRIRHNGRGRDTFCFGCMGRILLLLKLGLRFCVRVMVMFRFRVRRRSIIASRRTMQFTKLLPNPVGTEIHSTGIISFLTILVSLKGAILFPYLPD